MYNAHINPIIANNEDTVRLNKLKINATTNETIPLFTKPS